MSRIIFSLCFLLVLSVGKTQVVKKELNDFKVSLHEETINKVLAAVGDIKGTNDYSVMLIHGKYHWTVHNPQINIRPDSSNFTCDAFVTVGPVNYKTQVLGNVKISYDNVTDLISIRISRAVFELYTTLFGKKIHIKDIHLEEYFKDPFTFEGPRSMATDMTFMAPDSTIKHIYVQPTECLMELKWKEICTSCEVAASDKPFKPAVKVIPPVQAVKTGNTSVGTPQKK